jgi:hypothetical protein
MPTILYALPIVPGEEERVMTFGERLDAAGFRERYEELNRLAGVTRHLELVQRGPAGSLRLVLFETDAPERLGRAIGDDPYDRWWRDETLAAHGFDPAGAQPPPMSVAWDWHRPTEE